jgi:hypothetical protein
MLSVNDPPRQVGRPRKHVHAVKAPRETRTGVRIHARIDPRLAEAIPQFIAIYGRTHNVTLTTTATLEKALSELFQKWDVQIRK